MTSATSLPPVEAVEIEQELVLRTSPPPASQTSVSLHTTGSNQSHASTSSALVCRICQLTEEESGCPLEETGCKCKGSIRVCHGECIRRWIRAKGSTKCELCCSSYDYELTYEIVDQDQAESQVRIPEYAPMCFESRRVWFLINFSVLLLAATAACAMTLSCEEDHRNAVSKARAAEQQLSLYAEQQYEMGWGLGVSMVVFCACMTVGVGALWLAWEVSLYPREFELKAMINDWSERYRRGRPLGRSSLVLRRLGQPSDLTSTSTNRPGHARSLLEEAMEMDALVVVETAQDTTTRLHGVDTGEEVETTL